jgi:hypothetical protein
MGVMGGTEACACSMRSLAQVVCTPAIHLHELDARAAGVAQHHVQQKNRFTRNPI